MINYHFIKQKMSMKRITAITQKPIVMKMVGVARALFFMLGVITTLSTSQFFKSCKPEEKQPVAGVPVTDKEHKQQQKTIAAYDSHIAALSTENAKLQLQVTDTRTALARSHRSNAALQSSLQQQVERNAIIADTAERLDNCDSIARTAAQLLEAQAQQDSLYSDLTSALQQQAALKDSVIATQGEQFSYLQLSYERNMAQQQLLISDNLLLKKQVSRHRARSKLLTAGVIILTGTVTYMALQH